MNRISDRVQHGTLGELLVQIRLLRYGVQAAPPIKDSGNDLIAVNGNEFRAVSVRTTTSNAYLRPDSRRRYHVLAVVHLVGSDRDVELDQSRVFLIPRDDVSTVPADCRRLEQYLLCREHVERLFGPPNDSNATGGGGIVMALSTKTRQAIRERFKAHRRLPPGE